jgi:hypothetical protein
MFFSEIMKYQFNLIKYQKITIHAFASSSYFSIEAFFVNYNPFLVQSYDSVLLKNQNKKIKFLLRFKSKYHQIHF